MANKKKETAWKIDKAMQIERTEIERMIRETYGLTGRTFFNWDNKFNPGITVEVFSFKQRGSKKVRQHKWTLEITQTFRALAKKILKKMKKSVYFVYALLQKIIGSLVSMVLASVRDALLTSTTFSKTQKGQFITLRLNTK